MQRADEGRREVFDIREFFVAVMNQQHAGEDAQNQQARIGQKRAGENGAEHAGPASSEKLTIMGSQA